MIQSIVAQTKTPDEYPGNTPIFKFLFRKMLDQSYMGCYG